MYMYVQYLGIGSLKVFLLVIFAFFFLISCLYRRKIEILWYILAQVNSGTSAVSF